MSPGEKSVEPHAPKHGPLRRFLKLIVEIDSSRFFLSRVKAGILLLVILATFGVVGYGVPALLSRYF